MGLFEMELGFSFLYVNIAAFRHLHTLIFNITFVLGL